MDYAVEMINEMHPLLNYPIYTAFPILKPFKFLFKNSPLWMDQDELADYENSQQLDTNLDEEEAKVSYRNTLQFMFRNTTSDHRQGRDRLQVHQG